jgi:H+/Cl- antiporter ClcA
MAPFALLGTLLGHLVGASVGREGTAVQMSSSITEAAARLGRVDRDRRAVLARAALGGGFGSVFGVPWAGVVFALEASRRPTLRTVVAAAAASFVGHAVVVGLGHEHAARPQLDLPVGPLLPVQLLVAGLLFGITARLFHSGLTRARRRFVRHVGQPVMRPVIGGALTLGLALVVGRDALGLSLPLVDDALAGAELAWWMPWLKLLLTVLALGSGFVGGEVTPLFVVGATLGAVAASAVGMPQAALASIGLVSVFGAAARVPFTSAVMAAELFGWQALLPALVVTWVARAVAGRRGLYDRGSGAGASAR